MLMNHPTGGVPVSDASQAPTRIPYKIQVAALPWRLAEGGIQILLITSRESGRWILPKGWPEKNEALCDAAAREAGEEAGIRGAVEADDIGRYVYAKTRASGVELACEVRVFPLKVKNLADKWKEARERRRRWMRVGEAIAAIREPELCALIEEFSDRMAAKAA